MAETASAMPMNDRLRALLPLLPLLLAAGAASASHDDDLEDLLKREVEGPSRYAQSLLDAPAPVAVFGRREASLLGHQTVAEMLGRLPGVHLGHNRQYVSVGLRGLSRPGDYNARLLVTIDGFRVNDALYDQALPDTEFPLVAEWVKRLELVYGPSSSVYGANALLGVVNLVTVDGADAPGLRVQAGLGSFGTRRALLQYGSTGGTDLFVGAQLLRSEGEDLELPELGLPGRVRGLDGLRQGSVFAKLRRGPWRFSASAVQRDKDLATAPYGTLPGVAGTRYRDGYAHAELAYEEGWSDALRRSLRLGVAGSRFDGDYRYDGQLNRDLARSLAYNLDARLQWRGWLNHELQLGVDARWVVRGDQRNFDLDPPASYLDSRERGQRVGLFVQDQWRLSADWQLTGGLRVDRIRGFDAQWSPRLALVWRPQPQQALKLLLGRAFRAPNLVERFYGDGYTQISSPTLRPEHLRSAELSWERALDAHSALTLSAYRTQLRELIELGSEPGSGLAQYQNLGRIRTQGLDLSLQQQGRAGTQWRLDASLIDARRDGQRLSNAPRWLLKGHWIQPLAAAWTLGVELQAQGRRQAQVEVPSQFSANAALRWNVGDQQLGLRVLNLADRALYDPAGPDNEALLRVPQPRRSWRLDWSWRL
jgi:iron complex outermembrane receptor protein